MRPPFDIAADLDTPVSAFLKLKPLGARFLLESVERGEQVARFSFLGLGSALELHFDSQGLTVNSIRQPVRAGILTALREGLRNAPELTPQTDEIPFQGGLVGYADFDLIHELEQFPINTTITDYHPQAAYLAPRSLLVFDHLTRRVALLHAGPGDRTLVTAQRGDCSLARACSHCQRPEHLFSGNDKSFPGGLYATGR